VSSISSSNIEDNMGSFEVYKTEPSPFSTRDNNKLRSNIKHKKPMKLRYIADHDAMKIVDDFFKPSK